MDDATNQPDQNQDASSWSEEALSPSRAFWTGKAHRRPAGVKDASRYFNQTLTVKGPDGITYALTKDRVYIVTRHGWRRVKGKDAKVVLEAIARQERAAQKVEAKKAEEAKKKDAGAGGFQGYLDRVREMETRALRNVEDVTRGGKWHAGEIAAAMESPEESLRLFGGRLLRERKELEADIVAATQEIERITLENGTDLPSDPVQRAIERDRIERERELQDPRVAVRASMDEAAARALRQTPRASILGGPGVLEIYRIDPAEGAETTLEIPVLESATIPIAGDDLDEPLPGLAEANGMKVEIQVDLHGANAEEIAGLLHHFGEDDAAANLLEIQTDDRGAIAGVAGIPPAPEEGPDHVG